MEIMGLCPHNDADLFACNKSDAAALAPSWVEYIKNAGYPFDMLVFSDDRRRVSKAHIASSVQKDLPPGSFYRYSDNVLIPSACLTFLLMAKQLDVAELIAYGDELCGSYSFNPYSDRGMNQRTSPLVTKGELMGYVEMASGIPGVNRAKRAIEYIIEASASPMETVDEMLLSLSVLLGGYALQVPKMNEVIPLSNEVAQMIGKSHCKADLYWKEAGLIVEHQGLFDHCGEVSFEADRARVNGLQMEGFRVFEITTSLVKDLERFEVLAKSFASMTGKRLYPKSLGATPQRLALRKTLFNWNKRYGRPQ